MCCKSNYVCILPREYSLIYELLLAFASVAIRNVLGTSNVFQTLNYGAQAECEVLK